MWEIIKHKVEYWNWETSFGCLFLLFLAVLVFIFFKVATADKMVRCYYLGSSYSEAGIAYQIRSDIDYADDLIAFTSPDYKVTMSVFNQLPKCPIEV